jgi:hypothetical protein
MEANVDYTQSQETILAYSRYRDRTERLLRTFAECPSNAARGQQQVSVEEAFDHIFDPVTGCRWCQKQFKEV